MLTISFGNISISITSFPLSDSCFRSIAILVAGAIASLLVPNKIPECDRNRIAFQQRKIPSRKGERGGRAMRFKDIKELQNTHTHPSPPPKKNKLSMQTQCHKCVTSVQLCIRDYFFHRDTRSKLLLAQVSSKL
mmetsp:Transcript_39743/g.158126  ORF Transcript_39743/g.158126 Transcript_39743/m.158126 type:complete len:134 (+) Transcript_39743:3347-3748(+)